MNALQQEVHEVVSVLFQRHPTLCGFSVKEDLSFSNLACHPALEDDEANQLAEEISATLEQLLDEMPEAAELLRGRTLARIFH